MSFSEAVTYFKSLNVCRVKNWNEVRLKGKFLRLSDVEDPSHELVKSKWFYQIQISKEQADLGPVRLFVGVH